jgi:hypothetical protein
LAATEPVTWWPSRGRIQETGPTAQRCLWVVSSVERNYRAARGRLEFRHE